MHLLEQCMSKLMEAMQDPDALRAQVLCACHVLPLCSYCSVTLLAGWPYEPSYILVVRLTEYYRRFPC